jgi:hypothetical protein
MPVDDLWYKRGPVDPATGKPTRVPSGRHGRGKRWRARWVDDTGQPRQRLFDRKVDAERHEANERADVSRGVYVDERRGRVTVAEYGRAWRAQQIHRDSTAEHVERAFRLHIDPYLGKLPIGQVRTSHVRSWVKGRSEVLAPATVRLVYTYLSSMFSTAVVDRSLGRTPCVDIRLPEIAAADRYIPTP